MMRIAIAALAVTTGFACGAAADPAPNNTIRTNGFVSTEANDVPRNYRELVAAYLKQSLVDPGSLKDVGISEPAVRRAGWFRGLRPSVCVRYDAKNRRGLYTGASSTLYYFKGGQVAGAARRQAFCRDATYTAFREADPHAAIAARPARAAPVRPGSARSAERPAPKLVAREGARNKTSDAGPPAGDYRATRTYYDERHADTWYRQRS